MRKAVLITFSCALIFLAGCAKDEYSIEKEFYNVQKEAAKIFKNPDASPTNQLEMVVGLLNNFANKHPKSNLALEAQFNIARLYIVKKEYDKARSQLKSMLKQYSDSEFICSEALFLMGNSYEIEDKWESAQKEYQRIIQGYALTLRGLSTPIYMAQHYKIKYEPEKMMEAYKEAAGHYKGLAEKYPGSALAYTAYNLLAQCYMETKEWQNAINTYSAVLEKYKDEKYKGKVNLDVALMNIAVIYMEQLNDKVKAKETLGKLISDYPQSRLIKTATDLLNNLNKK